jgi:hypothetical protein
VVVAPGWYARRNASTTPCTADPLPLATTEPAVLLLRAVIANGDFPACWKFHVQQEHQRTHTSRYQDRYDLAARPTSRKSLRKKHTPGRASPAASRCAVEAVHASVSTS